MKRLPQFRCPSPITGARWIRNECLARWYGFSAAYFKTVLIEIDGGWSGCDYMMIVVTAVVNPLYGVDISLFYSIDEHIGAELVAAWIIAGYSHYFSNESRRIVVGADG